MLTSGVRRPGTEARVWAVPRPASPPPVPPGAEHFAQICRRAVEIQLLRIFATGPRKVGLQLRRAFLLREIGFWICGFAFASDRHNFLNWEARRIRCAIAFPE